MTLPFPRQDDAGNAAPHTALRLQTFASMAEAEAVWRALEADPETTYSPYQRFDFLAAWHRHIGERHGVTPLIVVGYDAHNRAACLWPLGQRRSAGTTIAEFLGGKYANYNGLIRRRDLDTSHLLPDLETHLAGSVDALILLNQPETWDGLANPLLQWQHTPSPDPAYSGALMPDYDKLLAARLTGGQRKKLRNRERVLMQFGDIRFVRAQSDDDARAVLAAFHVQKARRMQELGIRNAFAAPGVASFLEGAACGPNPTIELYALYARNEIVATYAGIVTRGRFSTTFNSHTRDDLAQASPGQLLLLRLIETLCLRGLTHFDLGVGEARYKKLFCKDAEPMFDSFLPFTPAGRMIAAAMRATYAAKRTIKRTPALWSAFQAARRWRGTPR